MSDFKALLLTDIVDSTRLASAIGDTAMTALWVAHDRLARDLLPQWNGREIDKTDGLLLLFDRPADAAGYALAYHRALATLPQPLKARAGIHFGAVILRENTEADVARGAKPLEVDGLAKPTAARVMSVAGPGQTLLTADARRALADAPVSVQSHGHWAMKGVAEPQELFELGEPGSAFAPPPDSDKVHRVVRQGSRWLPAHELPHNLPPQLTSFIGRDQELDEIKQRLGSVRLLTLIGMGGLGKTRLSIQVAAELMAEHPDGTWFLDLAPIRDEALVVAELAQAMGVREAPGQSLLHTVLGQLKGRRALIVMDNCEHLVSACGELAMALLRGAPTVRLLASSRVLLRVPGEQAFPIVPLPVPARDDGLDALARSTAVRLFIERVQAHKPGYAMTERDAPVVAELVARLEGIPLALELAAARIRSLSVADINARLKDRYRILTGGSRMLQERQQTLRALVDWSYDLLDERERRLLARLAVFAGGFDLAAAEAVCGGEPLAPEDLLDLLESLVEKSLVMTQDDDAGMRYRMLETIRDYAQEKLAADGDAADIAARHAMHYFDLAKEIRDGLKGPEQAQWAWRGETELDNLRTLMALVLGGGMDAVFGVKFAVAMLGFWILRGYATEGRSYVRALLGLPPVQQSPMAQAHALYVGAALAGAQSDHAEAVRMLTRCLELRRGLDSALDIAATLSTLALSQLGAGDLAAAEASEHEALARFRELDNDYGRAISHLHLGQIELFRGRLDDAGRHVLAGLELARSMQHQEIQAECERVLGQIALEADQLEEGERRLRRSLQLCRDAADRRGEAGTQAVLGQAELLRNDLAAARQRLTEAIRACRSFEMREELLAALEAAASLLRRERRLADAAAVALAAAQARERLGLRRSRGAELQWQAEQAALALAGAGSPTLPRGDEALDLDAAIRLACSAAEQPAAVAA